MSLTGPQSSGLNYVAASESLSKQKRQIMDLQVTFNSMKLLYLVLGCS
jgi:hypothetical protein